MLTKKEEKNAVKFICEKCTFECSKKSNYTKHLLTRKHNLLTSDTEKMTKMPIHICSHCDKEYRSREGLWKHKKTCSLPNLNEPSANEVKFLTNLVMEIVKNNNDL